jgi:hypothetical protein
MYAWLSMFARLRIVCLPVRLSPDRLAEAQCVADLASARKRTCEAERNVPGWLMALVQKDPVRPDRPILPGEDAFRFRHLLIRDAADEALAMADRAQLHLCFADGSRSAMPGWWSWTRSPTTR